MRQLKISVSITNRESASLNQYLADIASIPMVTAQEEVILTQKSGMATRQRWKG